MPKRVFISYDYDHDAGCKRMLVGQARKSDSPFAIADWSVKAASPGWRNEARRRIRGCELVIVLCGTQTHTATGVAAELKMAREEAVPYFLLAAYSDRRCTRPKTARASDKIYQWTWPNLKKLVGGAR